MLFSNPTVGRVAVIRIFLMASVALFVSACQPQTSTHKDRSTMADLPQPPTAQQREHVVQAPGGDRRDPWYWLRDDERQDEAMLAYLEAENAYKEKVLAP
jgi:hypothetical protein